MAKAKYFTQNNEKVYPISHTKAVYDGKGKVLEDRLTEDETAISSLQTDVKGKADKTDVDNKLNSNSTISDTTVAFTEASVRENIVSNEKSSTLFGKVQKWFSDLKKVAFTGSYNDLIDTPSNQIFVVCDGDHDELKLQAALSKATQGTVIYPIGNCVLTNENTQRTANVLSYGTYNAILNIGTRVTLDGTYCSSITFKNTNPATRQVILFLGIMAKLRNIYFQEDNVTCTQTSINPMVLFGNSNAIVDKCILGETYDVNQKDTTMGNIIMCSDSNFTNNVIDGWCLKTKTNIGACMKFTKVFVDNNKFTNIWTIDNSESGHLMAISSSIFINNVFEDNTVPQGRIYFRGNNSLCNHNIFNNSDINQITLTGHTTNNVFASLDLSEGIAISMRSICNDNIFNLLSVSVNENTVGFDLYNEATFANNYIKNLSITTADSTGTKEYVAFEVDKAFCRDNVILLSAATNKLENLYVIEANASSVVTGNVTSATSIGRLDQNCITENNTVAWS